MELKFIKKKENEYFLIKGIKNIEVKNILIFEDKNKESDKSIIIKKTKK